MVSLKTKYGVYVWAKYRELGISADRLTAIFSKYGIDPRSKEFREELLSLTSKFAEDAGEKVEESILTTLEESYEVSVG
jgi:hypothetical protein